MNGVRVTGRGAAFLGGVWPGKRTEVERVVLPFQTVETVNKPRVDQRRLDFGKWLEKAVCA